MIDALGYLAGVFAMISFLPQVVKTWRTKSAGDLSLPMLFLTATTNLLYVVYGLLLDLYPVVVMLGIMTGLVLVQIGLTVRYRTSIGVRQ